MYSYVVQSLPSAIDQFHIYSLQAFDQEQTLSYGSRDNNIKPTIEKEKSTSWRRWQQAPACQRVEPIFFILNPNRTHNTDFRHFKKEVNFTFDEILNKSTMLSHSTKENLSKTTLSQPTSILCYI